MINDINIGTIVVDEAGRRGVVTQVLEDDIGGFFARPEDKKYIETVDVPGVGAVKAIMATSFHPVGDGVYKGIWADGHLGEWVNVRVADITKI